MNYRTINNSIGNIIHTSPNHWKCAIKSQFEFSYNESFIETLNQLQLFPLYDTLYSLKLISKENMLE